MFTRRVHSTRGREVRCCLPGDEKLVAKGCSASPRVMCRRNRRRRWRRRRRRRRFLSFFGRTGRRRRRQRRLPAAAIDSVVSGAVAAYCRTTTPPSAHPLGGIDLALSFSLGAEYATRRRSVVFYIPTRRSGFSSCCRPVAAAAA